MFGMLQVLVTLTLVTLAFTASSSPSSLPAKSERRESSLASLLSGAVADAKYGGGGGGGGGGGYGGGSSGGGSYGGDSSGGGGGYGGGGGSDGGSYGGGGGGGGDSYGGGGGDSYGDSGGGGGGGYGGGGGGGDTGNLYYYYYPSQPAQEYNQMQSYNPPSYGNDYGGGGKDKDKGILDKFKKEFLGLGALSIPVGIAIAVAIPLLILGALFILGAFAPAIIGVLVAIFPALGFLLGRSTQRGNPGQDLFGIDLLQTVHSAFDEYKTLATDANCRRRVICEIGYVLKVTDDKNLRRSVIGFLDNMVPKFLRNHYSPLVESLLSSEGGKCQKYICNVARFTGNPSSAKGFKGSDTGGGGAGGGGGQTQGQTETTAAPPDDHSTTSTTKSTS